MALRRQTHDLFRDTGYVISRFLPLVSFPVMEHVFLLQRRGLFLLRAFNDGIHGAGALPGHPACDQGEKTDRAPVVVSAFTALVKN